MNRSLHPGAIAAVVTVLVVALGAMFVQFGDRSAGKSDAASPYTKVGERPTSPGSGINSITGEPLSQTAKDHTAATFAEHSRR
ncbi:MAG: hypothetical protein ACO1SV_03165 [Fimbriimonas sp.]